MSDSDPGVLSDRVETAQERFQYGQGAVEAGLGDPDSDAIGQLRKACRLLAAARSLRAANGFHTAVMELSFGARTWSMPRTGRCLAPLTRYTEPRPCLDAVYRTLQRLYRRSVESPHSLAAAERHTLAALG